MTKDAFPGNVGRFVRALMSSERLEDLPAAPEDPARESFLAWLLKSESLPMDEPRAGASRGSLLARIFARESLPRDEPPGAAKRHGD